jgi:hypothetical protein
MTITGRLWNTSAQRADVRAVVSHHATPPRVLLLAAVVSFLTAIPSISTADSTTFGLLFAGVPGLTLSVIFAAAGFAIAVRRHEVRAAAVALGIFIAVCRLPVALGAPMPLYSWTYKHLGVIDYIQTHGAVSHGVDIYSGWPGAFSAIAWFCSVTGLTSVSIAQWFSVGVHIALAAGAFAMARAFRLSTMVSLVVAFIVEIANWVGQDYLSPQAIAFVLAMVVITLLLRSASNPKLGLLALPVFAAIVATHQLTPYWLILIALVLGLLGRFRPRYIGLLFIGIAGGYLLVHLDAVGGHSLFSGFNLFANAQINSEKFTTSDGQRFTGYAAKLTAFGLWALAGITVIVAIRESRFARHRVVVGAVVAFSSFALLAVQNYGGEAIYRVFMFSIPGCALLLAPLVVRAIQGNLVSVRTRLVSGLGVAMLIGISLMSLQAYYGGWFSNLVTKNAYTTSWDLLEDADPSAYILSPAPGAPGRMSERYTQFAATDQFYDLSLSSWEGWYGQSFASTDATDTMTTELLATGRPVYVLVTQQMKDDADYYGLYPEGSIDRFAEQLSGNTAWKVVEASPGLELFELKTDGA